MLMGNYLFPGFLKKITLAASMIKIIETIVLDKSELSDRKDHNYYFDIQVILTLSLRILRSGFSLRYS